MHIKDEVFGFMDQSLSAFVFDGHRELKERAIIEAVIRLSLSDYAGE